MNSKLKSLLMGVGITAITPVAAEAQLLADDDSTYSSDNSTSSLSQVYYKSDIYSIQEIGNNAGCGNNCCGNGSCTCK